MSGGAGEGAGAGEGLPEGWVLCESKSLPGKKYYFDKRTGSSLWTRPPPAAPPAPPPGDPEPVKESKCKKRRHRDRKLREDSSPSPEDAESRSYLKRRSDSHREDSPVKRTRQETIRHHSESTRSGNQPSTSRGESSRGESSRSDARHKSSTSRDSPTKRSCPRKRNYSGDYDHSERQSPRCSATPTTSKSHNHSYEQRSGSFSKNLANKRMSELRSQQSKESIQNDNQHYHHSSSADAPKSHHDPPSKKHEFVSPNNDHRVSPVERPQNKWPNDHQHFQKTIPNQSRDSKLSPSNDSHTHTQGEPFELSSSPTQFLAANKIISSLKAQLSEERNIEKKSIDIFACLEEGINAPTIEFSSKNHPATPPQFSEANKIVTSIKTKLNENISDGERRPKFGTPANDRLSAFRSSLINDNDKQRLLNHNAQLQPQKPVVIERIDLVGNPVTMENVQPRVHKPVSSYSQEAMDVDYSRENSGSVGRDSIILVVDTNIFMHDIQFVKTVLESYVQGYKEKPTLVVPWQVMNELDRLKDNNNSDKSVCKKAKAAIDYLYETLPKNHRIKGQSIRDADSHIYPCELPDDEILNCCLQLGQRGNAVILVTNDKNLCNRATINSVRALGVRELKEMLRTETDCAQGDAWKCFKRYEGCLYQLLANILENEMREKYNNLWEHVLFKAPPWSLCDVLQCLLKHWIAVFNEVLPRVEPLIRQLFNTLNRVYDKGPNVLQSDVDSFKDLALELSSKCQIIPEYTELAKSTLERMNSSNAIKDVSSATSERDGEKSVTDAFENVWTVFSSYCAKLASSLGIYHQLEDRIPNGESVASLRSKYPVFSAQIQALTYALKKTLIANENSEVFQCLLAALGESQNVTGHTQRIDNASLRIFCLNNRSMLQEALVKFSQLTELLEHCRSNIAIR